MKLHRRTAQMQTTIKKVKSLILKENPSTPRFVASKLRMSCGTNILELTFVEEIPTSYEKDIDKVESYRHNVSSYTSKLIDTYLAMEESETKIKCLPFDEIRVTSSSQHSFSNGL
ncbi:hypothetical protein TNCV_240071 [Trichonephila clavipes]|nr:hypothetical protein TNCV_240071 [Trichonephila clavipes]